MFFFNKRSINNQNGFVYTIQYKKNITVFLISLAEHSKDTIMIQSYFWIKSSPKCIAYNNFTLLFLINRKWTPTSLFLGIFIFHFAWFWVTHVHNLHFNKLHLYSSCVRQSPCTLFLCSTIDKATILRSKLPTQSAVGNITMLLSTTL